MKHYLCNGEITRRLSGRGFFCSKCEVNMTEEDAVAPYLELVKWTSCSKCKAARIGYCSLGFSVTTKEPGSQTPELECPKPVSSIVYQHAIIAYKKRKK